MPTPDRLTVPSRINEAYVRAFVADGAGLPRERVIPANQNAMAPELADDTGSTPYATVLLRMDQADGRVFGHDGERGDIRYQSQYRQATFSVQFFSLSGDHRKQEGHPSASDLAARLCLWSGSDEGLLAAEGALRDPVAEGNTPAWPNGTNMRLDHPLSWERMDGFDFGQQGRDTSTDSWEERAYVEMTCRYVLQWISSDRGVEDFTVTVRHDRLPPVTLEGPPT